eukprot:360029-Chlamydomonas_euryale.AAC.2
MRCVPRAASPAARWAQAALVQHGSAPQTRAPPRRRAAHPSTATAGRGMRRVLPRPMASAQTKPLCHPPPPAAQEP